VIIKARCPACGAGFRDLESFWYHRPCPSKRAAERAARQQTADLLSNDEREFVLNAGGRLDGAAMVDGETARKLLAIIDRLAPVRP